MNTILPMTGFRSLAVLLAAALSVCAEPPVSVGSAETLAFLKKHCVACHGPDKQKGRFALHDLGGTGAGPDLERREKILEMVSIGDMPPEDEPQPTREERAALVDWITGRLQAAGHGRLFVGHPCHRHRIPFNRHGREAETWHEASASRW